MPAGYFCVSIIHRTLTWTAGALTCVHDLSYAFVNTRWFGTPTASQHNLFDWEKLYNKNKKKNKKNKKNKKTKTKSNKSTTTTTATTTATATATTAWRWRRRGETAAVNK